jgi:hypothetical protein
MAKKLEQLFLQDLKAAFRAYLKANKVPRNQHVVEWNRFWYELKDKCSVVDVWNEKETEELRIKPHVGD